jgi:2-polyprenyl-3-methyl-5-hydroxy-6-metoxy-1,4-benzoquinol methylase
MILMDKLVEVDAIWGQNTLTEALKGQQVDYIVASHVIEHVPDLIHFLIQILTGEFRSRKSLFTFNEIEQRL